MKQFIVLIAMIALGLMIFGLIAGPQSDSVYSVTKSLWVSEIQNNRPYP